MLALDSLSLAVRRGEVFGLLGPNGSGKTTTIRLLLGLLRPTSGWATVAGFDCWRNSLDVRRLVSYLPGELRMYGALSGLGTLKLLCDLRDGAGLDRAVAIAERIMKLNLRRKLRTYSTGMKQKLALAQVFSDPVDTLILDEPTSALDPSARSIVLGLVQEARIPGPERDLFRPCAGGSRAGFRSRGDHAQGTADARRGHARRAGCCACCLIRFERGHRAR